jgi:hypothetical protein
MPNLLDIDLLPLYRRAGQDQAIAPGLLVARKPRRPARSREADQLILHLALTGNATLPLDLQDKLLAELVKTYYDANGSVTAALRTTVETLNQLLLKRNLQSAGNQQMIGILTLATLRGDQLYLAQSGPAYACYLTAGQMQELYDPQLSGRGLGINQSAQLRYFHASLQPRDVLIIAVDPPSSWNVQTLAGLYGQGSESQQRSLLDQASDSNSVLLNVKPGAGLVTLLPARPIPAPARPELEPAWTAPAPLPASSPAPVDLGEDQSLDLVREQALLDQYQPLPELDEAADTGLPLASEAISVSAAARADLPVAPVVEASETPEPQKAAKASVAAAPGKSRSVGRALAGWLSRLLPEETISAIPNSVMAFFALATPLVIVAMATAVYFQRGLAAQSEIAYDQAVQAVAEAQGQIEPLKRREGLEEALHYLDAADTYRKLPETQSLRQAILADVDILNLVRRLDYQPAVIGGLPGGAMITRVVSVASDLYLLDSQNGKVLRAFFTNQGYQVDPTFQCGPGSPTNVGPLIDLSAWPADNTITASVAGIDAKGMMLFCSPGATPQAKKLPNPPNGELKDLRGFTLYVNDLYVLDPVSNSVWVYWGGDLDGEPAYYFDEQAPSLQDVVDLAATNEELYLLHNGGRMTLCITGQLGEATPNRCTDPAPYTDTRPGRESATLQPIPAYSQIQYHPPPDPSLYLLDPANQAIDRYSLRNLAYQSRFLPGRTLSSEDATAFWVDPVEQLVFLAIGNQVYYAYQP